MKKTIRVHRCELQPGCLEMELNQVQAALEEPNAAKSHLRNRVRLVSVYAVDRDVFAVYEVTSDESLDRLS